MQYMRSLQFIQDRKNWMTNILWVGLCLLTTTLIPFIGQIIMQGYLFFVIEALHSDPEHRDYPDFDLNRFTEYLSRGIWPFLVDLLCRAVIMAPLIVLYLIGFFVVAAAAKNAPVIIVLFYLVFFVILIAMSVVLMLVVWPATLYAGLSRKFDLKAMAAFVKDFDKRVLQEM